MSIEAAMKKALNVGGRDKSFSDQLERNRNFSDKMERAGVIKRKQEFSIPLMERIARIG